MRIVTLALALCLFGGAACAAGLPLPGKEDRCPVCGMFVQPFPQWYAGFALQDGRRFYFDGPKDMFTCLLKIGECLPGVTAEQVGPAYVTEYYSTRLMPAADVLFVTGSNVLGPMGSELVPVFGREAAETFRRDHGGQKVLVFDGRQLKEQVAAQ